MKLIGIDIGTSTICGVLYDTTTGQSESLSKANDTWLNTSHPWERMQDANRIVDIAKQLIIELLPADGHVAGIGLTGQMHGIVYLDGAGHGVSPLYTWQDGRAALDYKDGKSYAAWMREVTGMDVSAGYGLATHFYNLQNGLVPATAVRLCTIMDYVAMSISGTIVPLIDLSNAASLGLFDKQRLQFDERSLAQLGIDSGWLPTVARCVTKVGCMGDIPVYTAIGDNQAAFIGAMKGSREGVFVTVGTSAQMSVWTEEYMEVPSLETRPLPGGGYILVGAALCGGNVLATMKDFLTGIVEGLTSLQLDSSIVYDFMTKATEQANDSTLQVDTRFSGSREEPWRRGAISGITPSNFKIENMISGFYHGIAKELLDFYEKVPARLRAGTSRMVGTGNALKKNPPLQQCLQQLFGCTLSLSDCDEDAALGAALSIGL